MNPFLTRPRPYRTTQSRPSDVRNLSEDSRISKLDAINDLAERVIDSTDTVRTARDRVRKRVDAAIRNGELPTAGDGRLRRGDVMEWAKKQRTWAERLTGRPAPHQLSTESLGAGAKFGVPRAFSIPVDPDATRRELIQAQRRIHELEQVARAHEEELRVLRPVFAKREEAKAKARISGGMRRTKV